MKFRLVVNSAKRHYRWVEERSGVNGAQLWALWEIQRNPGLRVTELAAAMAVHQSTVSNLVDRLVRSGLVVRERSADDQRVVRLLLTRAGEGVIGKAPRPARGLLPEALHSLPANTLRTLDAALRQLLIEMRLGDRDAMRQPLAALLGSR